MAEPRHTDSRIPTLVLSQLLQLEASSGKQPTPQRAFQVLQQVRQQDRVHRIRQVATVDLTSGKTGFAEVLRDDTPVSNRLLYHIAGDPIGANDPELAGYNQVAALREFAEMLSSVARIGSEVFRKRVLEQQKVLQEGLAFLQVLNKGPEDKFAESSATLFRTLQALKGEESFVIPGGWAGTPGHSMVYELRKSKRVPGCFEVLIHNAGAGSGYHAKRSIDYREEVACLCIDEVLIENICDPIFLQCLQDLQTMPEGHEWSQDDVYGALLSLLEGTLRNEPSVYSDTQRSGTCSLASIFLYLQSKFSPRDYERLHVGMECKAIDGVVKAQKGPFSEVTFSLLSKCLI